MLSRWGFRRVLPLVMTAVQLVLLSMSLASQWRLPTNPGELHRRFPPTAPWVAGAEDETVTFSPEPTDQKTSTVFKVATALNLPAIFCGVLIGLPLVMLGLGSGEAWWIAIGMLLGIVLWWRIGCWADDQRVIAQGSLQTRSKWRVARRSLLRVLVICFLALFVLNLIFVRHHRTAEANFLYWTWIAWSCSYLVLSIWGERRETRLARAQAATCTADES